MKKSNSPIGIFDSGIGGLTVLKEIVKQLPNEDIVYFGDMARLPYGNKSARTVIRFSLENTKFLLKHGVKCIIVACNTSSSLALPTLRSRFKIPILGVIKSAVKEAVTVSTKGRIGIIGTRTTAASMSYQRQIRKINPRVKSFVQACPLFVPLAEEGWINDQVTLKVTQRYLKPLLKKHIDTLILGCTHYPILKTVIRKVAGEKINFVDSAKSVAQETKQVLLRNKLARNQNNRRGKYRFYVSDEPAVFRKVGRWFLGKNIKGVVRCMQ